MNLAGQVTTTAPNGPQTHGGQLPFIADSIGRQPGQTQGNQTTDPGLGILETGANQTQGVGYNVAAARRHERRRQQRLRRRRTDGRRRTGSVISPSTGTNSPAFLVFSNRSVTVPVTQSWAYGDARAAGRQYHHAGQRHSDQPVHQPRSAVQLQLRRHHVLHQPVSELAARCLRRRRRIQRIRHRCSQLHRAAAACTTSLASSGFNSITTKTVDLDSPANYPSLTILTIEDTTHPNAGLGMAPRSPYMPNLFGDGTGQHRDRRADATSLNGKSEQRRRLCLPACDTLPLSLGGEPTCINVQLERSAFIFAGANSGEQAGFSVANAGDVNGLTAPATHAVNDILIGAPRFNNNAGAAYLVYGGSVADGWCALHVPDGYRPQPVEHRPHLAHRSDPAPRRRFCGGRQRSGRYHRQRCGRL